MKFWTGVDPICMFHSDDGALSLYQKFPVIEIDLYTADYKAITLAISPQQYLRPVDLPGEPAKDCYKVGVTSSTQGTNIGNKMIIKISQRGIITKIGRPFHIAYVP